MRSSNFPNLRFSSYTHALIQISPSKLIALFVLSFLGAQGMYAQTMNALDKAVNQLNNDADMISANWGFSMVKAESGEVFYEFNGDKSLTTASTMKALTTATALSMLGGDFQFETQLAHTGTIGSDGTLEGDIVIVGSGDPGLGSNRFGQEYGMYTLLDTWADAIKKAGITSIRGKVLGDASIFETQVTPSNWAWEDIGNYYGSGPSGLNFHENTYQLDLKPGRSIGAGTEVIGTVPKVPELFFVNEITTGPAASGDNGYIYGAPYTHLRYLRGTIPAGKASFSIKGSLPDPGLFAAQYLTRVLRNKGVEVALMPSTVRREKIANKTVDMNRKVIFTHTSPPIREIIKATNMRSLNLFAEALLNQLGLRKSKPGSTENGLEVIEAYWEKQGVPTKGMRLRDGSGLSPNNALSALQFSRVLSKMYQSDYRNDFMNSLPVAGRSGTMSSTGRGTEIVGKLRAKSGFISGVRSYTGYVTTAGGEVYAFTMIANNYSCTASEMRRKFTKIMEAMVALQ